MMRKIGFSGFVFAAWICSFSSLAAGPGSPLTAGANAFAESPPPRHPHQPPREAIDACSGVSESAACTVTLHGHTIEGTCRTPPDGKGDLACLPNRPPGPPPEAVAACSGAAENASCTITLHGHTLDGVCRTPPDGKGGLACLPHHPPPPPSQS